MQAKPYQYLLNCFLLLLPIFLWNIIFAGQLPKGYQPELFDNGIPIFILTTENILRGFVFLLPAFMFISTKSTTSKWGWSLYLTDSLLYYGAWLMQLYFPETLWSRGILGFMAPAYTTLIWLVGIGLIGHRSYFKRPYFSTIYILFVFLFVCIHSLHSYFAFFQL